MIGGASMDVVVWLRRLPESRRIATRLAISARNSSGLALALMPSIVSPCSMCLTALSRHEAFAQALARGMSASAAYVGVAEGCARLRR
jgi:hypothetical protein